MPLISSSYDLWPECRSRVGWGALEGGSGLFSSGPLGDEAGDLAGEVFSLVVVDQEHAYVFVPAEALDAAHIAPGGLQRLGDGGVAQAVRARPKPSFLAQLADHQVEAGGRQPLSFAGWVEVGKERPGIFSSYLEPGAQGLPGLRWQRDLLSVLPSLPQYPQGTPRSSFCRRFITGAVRPPPPSLWSSPGFVSESTKEPGEEKQWRSKELPN